MKHPKYNEEMAQLFSEVLHETVQRYLNMCEAAYSEDSPELILEDMNGKFFLIWEDFTRD